MTWTLPFGMVTVPRAAGPVGALPAATVSGCQRAVQAESVQMKRPFFSALRL